jgi:hypothetical protein
LKQANFTSLKRKTNLATTQTLGVFMHSFILLVSLLSSLSSFANSLEPRHSKMIEMAISSECGQMFSLDLINTKSTVLMSDNGNQIIGFISKFEGARRIDQGVFDYLEITVESTYADGYDHSARDWGLFSVDSVRCELK